MKTARPDTQRPKRKSVVLLAAERLQALHPEDPEWSEAHGRLMALLESYKGMYEVMMSKGDWVLPEGAA